MPHMGEGWGEGLKIMYHLITIFLLIIFATLAWRDFRLAVFVLLASLPAYLLRFEIFNIPTTLLEIMIGIITLVWLINPKVSPFKNSKEILAALKQWWLPFSLLLIAGIISVVISPDKMAALGIFKAYLVEPIILFLIIRTTLKFFDDAEVALMFLGLGGLVVAAFAIFQHFTGLAIPIPWDIENRATGIFPYPNAVGLYLGPIIILGLGALWRCLSAEFYLRAWFWVITISVSTMAIIFSQTEAAWIALPVSLIVVGLFFARSRWFSILLSIIGIIIVLSVPTIKEKILLQDYSGQVRIKQWEETFNLLKENPLFGAGLSGYPTTLKPYHTHQEIEIFQYPHNIILNIWSELGLLGLVAFLAFFWQTAKLFKTVKKNQAQFFWLGVICFTALIETAIHGLVDVPFFKNDLALLTALILALLSWSATGPYAHKNLGQSQKQ